MPFQKPWRDYKVGDLFYGLAINDPNTNTIGGRNVLIDHLYQLGKVPLNTVLTIDEYDICSATHATANNLKFDPNFISALKGHKKYGSVVGKDMNWNATQNIGGKNQPVDALAIAKRKCKGGLNYITHYTPYYIHFCLDDLDMLSVPAKSYGGPGATDFPVGKSNKDWLEKVRSITGAELRWVYRNRNNAKVQTKIQFWLNNSQCMPPWGPEHPVKWRSAWAAYVPTHMAT